jgi:hypothetical protein
MEEKELIEKLEKIKIPEIELKSHKQWLKMKLIDWKYREKKAFEIFSILKKVGVFSGSLILILGMIFIATNFLVPKNNLLLAQKIALKNPEIKEMIERGAKIEDLKTTDDKAYLLISQTENELPTLTEVNLKERRVLKFEKILPEDFPLTEREKEKAKEIAKIIPEIDERAIIPKFEIREIEVKEIKLAPPLKVKLIKEKGQIKVVPKEKRVLIIYKVGQNKWLKRINITEERVEEIKFLGRE